MTGKIFSSAPRALCHALSVVVALFFALSLPAQAQQPSKIPRVGYMAAVSAAADAPRLEAFRQGLRQLGYVEGQNIFIEYRHQDRMFERLPEIAAELIRLKIDLLVAVTTNAAVAAKKATGSIPIVFMGITDPIAAGLVDSLARPEGNATGITNIAAVLTGKRLELFKETVPKLSRVAVLWDPNAPGSAPQSEQSLLPARELGLQLHSMQVSSVDNYEEAFREAARVRNNGLWVTLNPLANSNQKVIANLAIANRLPSVCARGDYAENGCMMAYGPTYVTEGQDGARYVDRILKGAKPGGTAGATADNVRASDQPEHGAAGRHHDPTGPTRACGQGDQISVSSFGSLVSSYESKTKSKRLRLGCSRYALCA